jgi:probable rRNA maturation factor
MRALKEVAISDASIKLPDANMTTAESFPTPWLFHEPQIMEWLKYVAGEEGKTWGSLHIAYYSDEDLLVVNRSYLQHDYYTDIITFDRCRGNRIHGDLAISVERIADHAQELGVPIGQEAARVHVHGFLHLCGYGDGTEEEKRTMRELEEKYIAEAARFGMTW